MTPLDEFDLQRFLDAQAGVYDGALRELRNGAKRGHWIWFVLPQLAGLGRSSTSAHYGIRSLREARAYLAHPVLGPRLIECFRALLAMEGKSARQILGSPDDLKLRSCATLFAQAEPDQPVFGEVLAKYYGSQPDRRTLAMLDSQG